MSKVLAHKIQLLGDDASNLYRDRLVQDQNLYQKRGLMDDSRLHTLEQERLVAVSSLLNQMQGAFVLKHPRYDIELSVDSSLGAKAAYLIPIGDYAQRMCEAVELYVEKGSSVAVIGAGVGLTSVLAWQVSGMSVVAMEPNLSLLGFIQKNAELNQAKVQIQHGCIVVGQKSGETDYHVASDLWSSSVYIEGGEELKSTVKVPVLDLSLVIDQHSIDTLVVDIQGSEVGLFDEVNMSSIKTAIIRMHTALIGERATAAIVETMSKQGFYLKDLKGWAFVFKK